MMRTLPTFVKMIFGGCIWALIFVAAVGLTTGYGSDSAAATVWVFGMIGSAIAFGLMAWHLVAYLRADNSPSGHQ